MYLDDFTKPSILTESELLSLRKNLSCLKSYDWKDELELLWKLGKIYGTLDLILISKLHIEKAINLCKIHNDKEREGRLYLCASMLEKPCSVEHQTAIDNAGMIANNTNNEKLKCDCLLSIASHSAFIKQNGVFSALELFEQTLKVAQKMNYHFAEAAALVMIYYCYTVIGNEKLSNQYYEQTEDIAKKLSNDFLDDYLIHVCGWIAVEKRKWEEALNYFDRNLQIRMKYKRIHGVKNTLLDIAECHEKLGSNQLNEKYYQQYISLRERTEKTDCVPQNMSWDAFDKKISHNNFDLFSMVNN